MSRGFLTVPFSWRPILAAAILIIVSSSLAMAQQPLGNISGVVTDPTGAVISGATVTATSLATGATRTATTNDQGYFLIPTLQAGEYKLAVTGRGFADFAVERVVVEVGQTARVDAALKVAGATETIQVAGAETATVDTQQTTVGGVVNTRVTRPISSPAMAVRSSSVMDSHLPTLSP